MKEGDIDKEQIENPEFGRIAAQAAKQVIVQKVRDAERLEIIKKFRPYIGTLVNGTVKKLLENLLLWILETTLRLHYLEETWFKEKYIELAIELKEFWKPKRK